MLPPLRSTNSEIKGLLELFPQELETLEAFSKLQWCANEGGDVGEDEDDDLEP